MLSILIALQEKFPVTPLPKSYVVKNESYIYVDQLNWMCQSKGKDCVNLFETAKEVYTDAFFPKGKPEVTKQGAFITKLAITLETTDIPKSVQKGNETYKIVTNQTGIYIDAYDSYACSRALATVAQLISERPGDEYVNGLYSIQSVEIQDFPSFPYRMVMYDTSRHFLPLRTLKRQVRALSVVKYNVMQIHIIDVQSNALQSDTKPADELGQSAYNVGGFYKIFLQQLSHLSEYANDLGVHIVVEVDQPGHSDAFGKANPNLVAYCPSSGYNGKTVNPLSKDIYVYLKAFILDILQATFLQFGKDPIIHLGGDEVDHNCWKEDPNITAYMKEKGINTNQLWKYYHKMVQDVVSDLTNNKTTFVYWQESFQNGNDMNNSVCHSWMDANVINDCLNKNVPAIRSFDWYLDQQYVERWYGVFQDSWQDMYQVKMYDKIPDDKRHLMFGGGTCMWGEKTTEYNIDEFVWPRSIAAVENLWSAPADTTITDQLKQRLQKSICKLLAVGVASGPIIPSAPCPGQIQP